MKILFNTDQIYKAGGIEKVMTEKANYFIRQKDIEVYIVTTEQQGNQAYYTLDQDIQLIDLNINYNRDKSYFSLENLKKARTHYRRQKKLFRKIQPDVIISPNFNFDHYWLPFIKNKSRLIKEWHGSRYMEKAQRENAGLKQRMAFALNDWIYKKYDSIVVLNKDEKEFVKSGNVVVIPNPITIPDFKSSVEQKLVLAAGRLAPIKAFEELIEIWRNVAEEFPDWQLHIYGDDYSGTKKKLEKLILELDLYSSIKILESEKDFINVMHDYSIYAMTSVSECFPMVLLESLSLGVPVVSYDCPFGPRNIIIDKEDGFLIKDRNKNEFALKLKMLMNDIALRKKMGIKGRENVERYSLNFVMKKWLNFLG